MFEKGSSLNLTLSSCFWGFLDENIDKVLLSEINQNWFSSSGGGQCWGLLSGECLDWDVGPEGSLDSCARRA